MRVRVLYLVLVKPWHSLTNKNYTEPRFRAVLAEGGWRVEVV